MKKKTKKNIERKLKRHKNLLIVCGVAVLLFTALLLYVLLHSTNSAGTKRLVTFYDRGKKISALTRAETVQGAMQAASINVDPHDIVEPAQDSTLTSTYVDVIIYRSRLVAITDGNVRQTVLTVAQSPNAVLKDADLPQLGPNDKAAFKTGSVAVEGTPIVLSIERAKDITPPAPTRLTFTPRADALTVSKGAQIFVDSQGVAHRETYYDLPMNRVVGACGGSYTIRSDGAKVDQNGFVLVAANLNSYPRCSVVETSLGPGKVYDTGGFAVSHPYGFDLATDWTNYNGQ